MIILPGHSNGVLFAGSSNTRHNERGAALAIALMMMILLSAIALGVLAVVQGEAKVAGSDLKRTEACYASAAALEIMTNDFSELFAHTSRPTTAEIQGVADTLPTELTNPTDPTNIAYTFPDHILIKDTVALALMGTNTTVQIPNGPFNGLIAGVTPYKMTTTAQSAFAQCKLTRDMKNYLIPLFQFGMFSDKDIELHPGEPFTFNGRVHANGNIYVNGAGPVTFLDKVTTANELVYDRLRNNNTRSGAKDFMKVGSITVEITKGSVNNGPNLPTATASPVGQRGYFPGSPDGTINTSWNTTSVATATSGTPNQFGGQLLTRTTGAAALKLPLQMDGSPTRELIKRNMPNDNPDPSNPSALSESRYHSKSRIRILIDDEVPNLADGAGIPAGQGVNLSTFDPVPLPNTATDTVYANNGGGRSLWRINDNNTAVSNSYLTTNPIVQQFQQTGAARQADTVRGVKTAPASRNITAVAKVSGSPILITSALHGFVTNDLVVISGVGGTSATTLANNLSTNTYWPITVTGVNTFTLNGTSSTAVGAYVGTGTTSVYKLTRSVNNTVIPYGAGITGRILIQIEDAAGNTFDVTQQILSMGVTEGEPNSIVQLQRPLWASFTQGSRDASGGTDQNLADILNNLPLGADGEIRIGGSNPILSGSGYLTSILDDLTPAQRSDIPQSNSISSLMSAAMNSNGSNWASWNAIVPINVYNMREGHLKNSMTQDAVYERGITNIVELNMRNLARWIDGVFDQNLLAGTNAVSGNIGHVDGYTVYISDRRGDRVKSMTVANPGSKPVTFSTYNASNGMVDNLDIYGPNGTMDAGEDVQNKGLTVGASLATNGLKDTTELPDPVDFRTTANPALNPAYSNSNPIRRAIAVAAWKNLNPAQLTNHNYFRNAVRLFNGETLQVTGSAGARLSTTHGITVATENMVYIWGNYNTTGINQAPASGTSSLNISTSASRYCPGPGSGAACASTIDKQVPASIVADAFFPQSKTWFDGLSAFSLDDYRDRTADRNLPSGAAGDRAGTSVRAGIIAGNNLGALEAASGEPDAGNGNDSRLNGGMHNFPRFAEDWTQRWNFVGSFVPLYNSTQALGQWWYVKTGSPTVSIYGAPIRNWAFDTTFLQMDRLPPGTPMFQYIAPSAFRQVL